MWICAMSDIFVYKSGISLHFSFLVLWPDGEFQPQRPTLIFLPNPAPNNKENDVLYFINVLSNKIDKQVLLHGLGPDHKTFQLLLSITLLYDIEGFKV